MVDDDDEIPGELVPPVVTQALTSLTVEDGSMARLECMVSGKPKPNIAWFHESTLIEPSPDFMQFYDNDNLCSLVIKEVFPEDTGKYTMAAKNTLGKAVCSAELLVEDVEGKKNQCHLAANGLR